MDRSNMHFIHTDLGKDWRSSSYSLDCDLCKENSEMAQNLQKRCATLLLRHICLSYIVIF